MKNTTAGVTVSRREWVLVIAVALALTVLLLLPYWVAYETAVPETVFSGTLMNVEDSHTYFAKIRAGLEGEWLYRDPFTPEAHEPFFVGIFYIGLGQIARALDLSLMTVWHSARFVTGFLMFVAIFAFVAAFARSRGRRWLGFLLASLGSGMGWILFLLGQPLWLGTFPIDFWMAEARPFFTALTFPHIALTTALLLGTLWLTLRVFEEQGRRRWLYAAAAGLVNLLIALFHPLLIYVVVLTNSLYWLVLALRGRRILWAQGFALVVAFVPPGLTALYYSYLVTTHPVFAAWNARRDGTVSPPWPHFIMAYGLLLLFAGLLWMRRRTRERRVEEPRWLLLWVWVAAVALLIYAPLGSQRRFVQGVHVPLALLAATGFLEVFLPVLFNSRPVKRLLSSPRYSQAGLSRLLVTAFVGIMALSNLYVLSSVLISSAVLHPDLIFRPAAEMAATDWLRTHTEQEALVLAAYETGNYVAAQAGNPVMVGHWAETVDFPEKAEVVDRFFEEGSTDEFRRRLLAEYGVEYVWFGPREQELGAYRPDLASFLEIVYAAEGIQIFRVVLDN